MRLRGVEVERSGEARKMLGRTSSGGGSVWAFRNFQSKVKGMYRRMGKAAVVWTCRSRVGSIWAIETYSSTSSHTSIGQVLDRCLNVHPQAEWDFQ